MPFDPVDSRQSFPDLEEGILQYWKEQDTFKRSIKQRSEKGDRYTFYDGPPFATGLPHYGHLLAGTIKDVIPRYHAMRGKYVERRFGWDCHGLPIENIIEKENDILGPKQIEELGVDKFNDLCRGAVLRYTSDWRTVVERMGRWVDMDWDYRTMDPPYMESMWWAFKELYKKDLIYQGHKSMHICPRCVTPLSNFEVTQGYADVDDTSVTWKFALLDEPKTFVLAWTTTPWSTPSTMGLSIKAEADYVKVSVKDEQLIFAKNRLESIMKGVEDYEVVEEFKGKKLVGSKYQPIVDWYAKLPEVKDNEQVYQIFAGDYVEETEGTGLVTINGSYGEVDMEAAEKNGLPIVMDVDMDGRFNDLAKPLSGLEVKEGQKTLIADLKKQGLVWQSATIRHSYPHCWRCDSPLLNYATSSWFVAVEKLKDKMLQNNATTAWVPDHIRDGRYGNWLDNARDWAISRNRYWGTPLPIWQSADGETTEVIGSRDQLMSANLIRFTKLTALRHGESEGNLTPIYQGKAPGTDLTKAGKAQVKESAKWLTTNEHKPAVIYCSPLARTVQTAQILAKELGIEVVIDERLREIEFGEYEGKTVDFGDPGFLQARRAHKMNHQQVESIYHFEGMETWESVYARVEEFMNEVLPRHRSEHILVVTHADVMQNLRGYFDQEDPAKLCHQPYPAYAKPYTFFWDHQAEQRMDLHKDVIDDVELVGPQSDQSVELTLVRHGETDWNKEGKAQGKEVDKELNDTGIKQAEELAASLNSKDYDLIITSNMKRAAQTAAIIADKTGIPLEATWDELTDRGYGELSGQQTSETAKKYFGKDDDIYGIGFLFAHGKNGESFNDLITRGKQVCERILNDYPGKKILLVSHSGTTRALMTVADNLGYKEANHSKLHNLEAKVIRIDPPLKRIPEVLDCWFESGSMPYAQQHFPFEFGDDPSKFPLGFPAEFIAEGIDQCRAWFYTLMVLSTALFGKSPFKNVVVNGIVLAEDGKKMSKKLKNYPDPMEVVNRHGADAVRFTLMSSPAVRAEDLRFSEKLVEDTVRSVLLPLWNTYSFLVTYANAANFEPVDTRTSSTHPMDEWIEAEVQDLVNRMTKELDGYDLSATCSELHETIDMLTNWYVRLSRKRFGTKGEDQLTAMHTLYDVLLTLCQLLAPFCPYITEAIYLNLISEEHHSIHLTDWPEVKDLTPHQEALLKKTRLLRLITSLGLSVRGEAKVKNRQPLAQATIALPPALAAEVEMNETDLATLKQELNVKAIEFTKEPEALADVYVDVDARAVGPRLGSRVQEVIQAGKNGDFIQNEDGTITIGDETMTAAEARIVYRGKEGLNVAADRGVVVSLDTNLTPELESEGQARDLIRTVQRLRKEAGLSFTDKITLSVTGLDEVIKTHEKMILNETRANLGKTEENQAEVVIGDAKVKLAFEKS